MLLNLAKVPQNSLEQPKRQFQVAIWLKRSFPGNPRLFYRSLEIIILPYLVAMVP